MIVVDSHTPALEAMCGIPVEMLIAVPGLAATLSAAIPADSVVVAPDRGAVRLAGHYASLLQSTVAVVRKTRCSGASVRAEELVGEVRDRPAVIIDGVISTGGTIEAAVHLLRQQGAASQVTVAATHGPLTAAAHDRLSAVPVQPVVVTDSISHRSAPPLDLRVHFDRRAFGRRDRPPTPRQDSRRPAFPRLTRGTGAIKERKPTGTPRQRTRRTGRFEYRTTLPHDVDANNIEATLSDGVLTVRVPISEKAKPRKVKITQG